MAISTQATLLAVLAGALGAAIPVLTARRADTSAQRGLDSLASAVVWSGGIWIVAFFARMVLGDVTVFEAMSFIYLAAVVAAPMIGLGALVAQVWPARAQPVGDLTRGGHVGAIALLLLAPIGLYASRVEPRHLVVERVDVAMPADAAGEDPVRVGVISDLQPVAIGPHERRAVDLLLDEKPDVVLIAGDLFQGTADQWSRAEDEYLDLLRQLDAVPGGAFVVGGDVDGDSLPGVVQGTGVHYLRVGVSEVEVGDRMLRILGLPLRADDEAELALETFAAEPRAGAVTILLAHRPDWAQRWGQGPAGVDLVVAGHTHGGQVQAPLFGPLLTMTDVPRGVAAGGLHELDGQLLYVSTGVGMEQQGAPQIRFGARPSVAILTLS